MIYLSDPDAHQCTQQGIHYCSPSSPVYSLKDTKSCIASLFTHNNIDLNCRRTVLPMFKLPTAFHIYSGLWIISTAKPLILNVICDGRNRRQITIQSPIQLLALGRSCYAVNNIMMFPSFFQTHSRNVMNIPNNRLMQTYNLSFVPQVWKPLTDIKLSDSEIHIPSKLADMNEIPMSSLEDVLKQVNKVDVNDTDNTWNWDKIILITLAILIFFITLYIIFSKLLPSLRKHFDCYANSSGRDTLGDYHVTPQSFPNEEFVLVQRHDRKPPATKKSARHDNDSLCVNTSKRSIDNNAMPADIDMRPIIAAAAVSPPTSRICRYADDLLYIQANDATAHADIRPDVQTAINPQAPPQEDAPPLNRPVVGYY